MALLVLRQITNIVVFKQWFLDYLEFLLLSHSVDYILKRVSAPIAAGYVNKLLSFYLFQKVDSLVDLKVLDQFRAKIIAIIVSHQIREVPIYLVYYFVYKRIFRYRKMVLKKLGAYFFSCQLNDLTVQHLEFFVRIFVGLLHIVLNLEHKLVIRLVTCMTISCCTWKMASWFVALIISSVAAVWFAATAVFGRNFPVPSLWGLVFWIIWALMELLFASSNSRTAVGVGLLSFSVTIFELFTIWVQIRFVLTWSRIVLRSSSARIASKAFSTQNFTCLSCWIFRVIQLDRKWFSLGIFSSILLNLLIPLNIRRHLESVKG